MKNKFIVGLLALVFALSSVYGDQTLTKEERWDNMATEVVSWTDGLGLPIDTGIMDTVIALNLLGLHTVQSCEGHLDWGTRSPWVAFTIPLSKEIGDQWSANEELIKTTELALSKQYPNLDYFEIWEVPEYAPLLELFRKRHSINDMIDGEEMAQLTPLLNALSAFYETHQCPYDCRLTLSDLGFERRLESAGARWQGARPENERIEKLAAYQQEMRAFTEFLKANLI